VQRLFSEDRAREQLGDHVVEFILDRIKEQMARDSECRRLSDPTIGTVGLNYLFWEYDGLGSKCLGAVLNDKFGAGTWQSGPKGEGANNLVTSIKEIGQAAYLPGLPTVTGSNPVYSAIQRPAIEVWKGRHSSAFKSVKSCRVSSRVDLTTFVSGINKLNFGRLMELRKTDQWGGNRSHPGEQ
jgi:hypothetical protein